MKSLSLILARASMATPLYVLALAVTVLRSFVAPCAYAQTTDIQMMPPTKFGNATGICDQGGALFWDLNSPIHCMPGIQADASGTITGITSNSTTTKDMNIVSNGPIAKGLTIVSNGASKDVADTVFTLANMTCPSNQAMTISGGVPSCISVANIPHVTTDVVVPTCGDGQQIYFDPTLGFVCQALPMLGAPSPPICNGGNQTLQYDGTNFQCVKISAPPPDPQVGQPLYLKYSNPYTGPNGNATDWNKYNSDLNAILILVYGSDTASINAWTGACSVSSSGQINPTTTSDPTTYQYCGRFMCRLANGVAPFMAMINDQCEEGGPSNCNSGHFFTQWACLNAQ